MTTSEHSLAQYQHELLARRDEAFAEAQQLTDAHLAEIVARHLTINNGELHGGSEAVAISRALGRILTENAGVPPLGSSVGSRAPSEEARSEGYLMELFARLGRVAEGRFTYPEEGSEA